MTDHCPTCKRKMPTAGEVRTIEQNKKMWAMLGEVATQKEWYGARLSSDEWKDVFTAALRRQKVVPGIDGGFVVIGARTGQMKISEMSELIELITAFGVEHGIRFADDPEQGEA